MNSQPAHSGSLSQYYTDSTQDIYFSSDHEDIYSSLYYVLSMKGKKIRPLLVLHANQLFGGVLDEALPAAVAVELFHNFTLVHDDIMDEAPKRRGVPTVHKKYGLGTAINTGDLLMIMAYKHLTSINGAYLPEAFALYNQISTKIMEGQALDLAFEHRDTVSAEEYIKMIELKTSVLIAFCFQLGALIAGASSRDQELMYELGRNLGLCFQIKDDWLDTYGDQKTGKKVGGDIVANKKTFLYIQAWQLANEEQKKQLLHLRDIADDKTKIEQTMALFGVLQINEKVTQVIEEYYTSAIECLDNLTMAEEKKQPLRAFIKKIYLRDY